MEFVLKRTAGVAALATGAIALALAAPASAERTVVTANSGSLSGIESLTPFTVDANGELEPKPVVPTSGRPEGVAISPDARFVYVSILRGPPGGPGDPGQVQAFAIDPAGTLSEITGSPFATGDTATTAIAITPAGDRLIAVNRGLESNDADGSITVYDRDQTTGALTQVPGSPFAVAGIDDPNGIAIAPGGSRASVVAEAAGPTFVGRVAVLDINAATGELTSVAGSPFALGGGSTFPIVVTPDGARIVIADASLVGGQILVAEVNQATGALSPTPGSPIPSTARGPIGLALSPNGGQLYSAERIPLPPTVLTDGVASYALAANGALTPVAGSPFLGGGGRAEAVAATPDGTRVFSTENSNPGFAAGYSVQPGGALAALANSPYPTGDRFAGFLSIAMTPSNTPQPSFAATPAEPGKATAFDASATTVPGGRATRFDWDFGDGTALPDGGPTPTHAYAAAGSFTAKVTVTNDCDPNAVFTGTVVFTGQTAHCNGAREATATNDVTIPAPPTPLGPAAAAICRPVTSPPRTSAKGVIRLSAGQFRINQRIYAEALRRARAINAWLDAGIEARDLCGGGIGAAALNAASITTGPPPSPQPARPGPDPRPIVKAAKTQKSGVRFTESVGQLRINQAIASRAVREANALKARLDGGLTGGDVDAGAVIAAKLATNIGIAASTPLASPPAASQTLVAAASAKTGVRFRLTDGQVATNQRIGQTAIRRLRAVQDRLLAGFADKDFQPGSLSASDLG